MPKFAKTGAKSFDKVMKHMKSVGKAIDARGLSGSTKNMYNRVKEDLHTLRTRMKQEMKVGAPVRRDEPNNSSTDSELLDVNMMVDEHHDERSIMAEPGSPGDLQEDAAAWSQDTMLCDDNGVWVCKVKGLDKDFMAEVDGVVLPLSVPVTPSSASSSTTCPPDSGKKTDAKHRAGSSSAGSASSSSAGSSPPKQ